MRHHQRNKREGKVLTDFTGLLTIIRVKGVLDLQELSLRQVIRQGNLARADKRILLRLTLRSLFVSLRLSIPLLDHLCTM